MEPQATDTGRKLVLQKEFFGGRIASSGYWANDFVSIDPTKREAARFYTAIARISSFRHGFLSALGLDINSPKYVKKLILQCRELVENCFNSAEATKATIVVEPTTGDIILIALFNLETAISFANMFTGIRNNSSCCFTCIIFCFKSCQKHRLRSRSISFSVCEEAKQVFEINVNRRTGSIFIGYAPKTMKFNCAVGRHNRSYSNESTGKIRGIAVPGCSYTVDGVPYIEGWPEFGRDNIISCGLSDTGRIVYTRHGQSLDTGDLFVHSEAELFPCISLLAPFDQIKANFGPNFAFMRR
uniref:B30.2/SPRY domain-containing protein n=1 Tax=Globodera rostochiensis TaxID=31243 RepID=A0A914HR34_GLORO